MPETWLVDTGVKMLPPPDKKSAPEPKPTVPAGIRKVLEAICDSDDVPMAYFPTLLEMSIDDARPWLVKARDWCGAQSPPVVLLLKNGVYSLGKSDKKRVQALLKQ